MSAVWAGGDGQNELGQPVDAAHGFLHSCRRGMQGSFDRCIDIGEEHIAAALLSRQAFAALLERAVAVARPEEGGPKLLVAFSRLATSGASWLEGELRVELSGDDDRTTVTVLGDFGADREKIFPAFTMQVPFDEFVRAARLVPKLIAPLLAVENGDRLILCTKPAGNTSLPPPIDIDEASLQKRPSRRPTVSHMSAVHDDIHTKPTVNRMAAVRPEDMLDDE